MPEWQNRAAVSLFCGRGWTPLSEETLDTENQTEGDTKEGLYFGREVPADSPEAAQPLHGPNQWPSPVSTLTLNTAECFLDIELF